MVIAVLLHRDDNNTNLIFSRFMKTDQKTLTLGNLLPQVVNDLHIDVLSG